MSDWSIERSGFDLRQEAAQLRNAARAIDKTAAMGTRLITQHIARRSVANAPILTGDLRRNIRATPVESRGDETKTFSARVVIDPKIWYAPLMYAFLSPYAGFVPLFNLGPISRRQPGTVEGGVGGTWTDRVVRTHEQQYFDGLVGLYDTLILQGVVPREMRLTP